MTDAPPPKRAKSLISQFRKLMEAGEDVLPLLLKGQTTTKNGAVVLEETAQRFPHAFKHIVSILDREDRSGLSKCKRISTHPEQWHEVFRACWIHAAGRVDVEMLGVIMSIPWWKERADADFMYDQLNALLCSDAEEQTKIEYIRAIDAEGLLPLRFRRGAPYYDYFATRDYGHFKVLAKALPMRLSQSFVEWTAMQAIKKEDESLLRIAVENMSDEIISFGRIGRAMPHATAEKELRMVKFMQRSPSVGRCMFLIDDMRRFVREVVSAAAKDEEWTDALVDVVSFMARLKSPGGM